MPTTLLWLLVLAEILCRLWHPVCLPLDRALVVLLMVLPRPSPWDMILAFRKYLRFFIFPFDFSALNMVIIVFSPFEFVEDMRKKKELISGIGHKVKSIHNPDKRVSILKEFVLANFPTHPVLDYALESEFLVAWSNNHSILAYWFRFYFFSQQLRLSPQRRSPTWSLTWTAASAPASSISSATAVPSLPRKLKTIWRMVHIHSSLHCYFFCSNLFRSLTHNFLVWSKKASWMVCLFWADRSVSLATFWIRQGSRRVSTGIPQRISSTWTPLGLTSLLCHSKQTNKKHSQRLVCFILFLFWFVFDTPQSKKKIIALCR